MRHLIAHVLIARSIPSNLGAFSSLMLLLACRPDQITYTALMDACSRANQMGRVSEVLQDMVARGVPPDLITCNTIINGYVRSNLPELAVELVELVANQPSLVPDECTFRPILELCVSSGGAHLDRVYGVICILLEREELQDADGRRRVGALLIAFIDTCLSAGAWGDVAAQALMDLQQIGVAYDSRAGYSMQHVRAADEHCRLHQANSCS